jgi:L-iditol 2-dehydrogenase
MVQAFMPEAKKILYREVEKPRANPGEVLIRVSKIGICGSDLHVYEGKHPLVHFPLVQGHEFSGYVSEAGKNVEGLAPGDLVVVQPAVGCGICEKCKAGIVAQCEKLLFIGGALPGGGSEYIAVDAHQVLKLKEGVTPEDAAMIEPLAVAVHNCGKVPSLKGRRVAVMGAGTIGNLTAQVAGKAGADVVVFDMNEARLRIAAQCGLQGCHLNETGIKSAYLRHFGTDKVHVSFECVGRQEALNNCIDFTERGGYVVVPGVYSAYPQVNMIYVQDGELHVVGSLMYTWDDYREAVSLVESGEIRLAELRTHLLPFRDWAKGYELLLNPLSGALKVMIDMDDTNML